VGSHFPQFVKCKFLNLSARVENKVQVFCFVEVQVSEGDWNSCTFLTLASKIWWHSGQLKVGPVNLDFYERSEELLGQQVYAYLKFKKLPIALKTCL
jgi:hypothetical protein